MGSATKSLCTSLFGAGGGGGSGGAGRRWRCVSGGAGGGGAGKRELVLTRDEVLYRIPWRRAWWVSAPGGTTGASVTNQANAAETLEEQGSNTTFGTIATAYGGGGGGAGAVSRK